MGDVGRCWPGMATVRLNRAGIVSDKWYDETVTVPRTKGSEERKGFG